MEQNKKHLTLKDFNNGINNALFSSLLGDGKGNYNLFRIIIDPNAPILTQRIYNNDYRNQL
jgi:hypothetical protein